MKNNLIILSILILFSNVVRGQKKETRQYVFDYLIEYELTLNKDSTTVKDLPNKSKKYYLTNSKDNDFFALVTELDSLNYGMYFEDRNGVHARLTFPKSELDRAEFINIECKDLRRMHHSHKNKTKIYDFNILSDTIIEGKSYNRYKLASIKPKKTKRMKLGTKFYIVNPETRFHLPMLTYCTEYEEWKSNKNLPNGIFVENYFIDYNGDLGPTEKLVGFWKIDKKIVIQEECIKRSRSRRGMSVTYY